MFPNNLVITPVEIKLVSASNVVWIPKFNFRPVEFVSQFTKQDWVMLFFCSMTRTSRHSHALWKASKPQDNKFLGSVKKNKDISYQNKKHHGTPTFSCVCKHMFGFPCWSHVVMLKMGNVGWRTACATCNDTQTNQIVMATTKKSRELETPYVPQKMVTTPALTKCRTTTIQDMVCPPIPTCMNATGRLLKDSMYRTKPLFGLKSIAAK